MPTEITITAHNGSNYDYHFIIKGASRKIWNCLGENTEKYTIFSAPIKKKKLQELIKMAKKIYKNHILPIKIC